MSKPKLNIDEKEILKDFEAGEFESVLTPGRKKYIQASAGETFKKDKRINLRLSQKDYHQIQVKAVEEGIPYQTLISSIIHKYINGSLVPKQ